MFCRDNHDKIKPIHYAIYYYAIDLCNKLGWADKFGIPTDVTMHHIGVKNYKTYINGLEDLEDFGFIKFIERSKNQFTSNVICFSKKYQSTTQSNYQSKGESTTQSTTQSTVSINKPLNLNKPNKVVSNSRVNTSTDCFPKKVKGIDTLPT